MKKIILIDTSDIGAAYSAEAIKELGFEPVFFVNFNDIQGETVKQVRQYPHYQVDTKSLGALMQVIQDNAIHDIEGVITALDSRISMALALAKQLNVRGMCQALDKVMDKNNVSNLIPEYSPKSLTFSVNPFPVDEIKSFMEKNKNCFIKPIRAAGGVGGKLFSSDDAVDSIGQHVKQFPHTEWILMEYIDGELLSLEGFVKNKDVLFMGFTSRKKVGNTESYMEFPHDEKISISLKKQAKRAVSALIERSGYTRGYFHTEFMITAESAYLIDANFGRLGGGALLEIIAYAYDISPIDVMRHVFSLTLFPEKTQTVPYSDLPKHAGAAINYSLPVSGKLVKIEARLTHKVKHMVILDQGIVAPAAGENNWSWVGFLSGNRTDVLDEINNITLQTQEGSFSPCY